MNIGNRDNWIHTMFSCYFTLFIAFSLSHNRRAVYRIQYTLFGYEQKITKHKINNKSSKKKNPILKTNGKQMVKGKCQTVMTTAEYAYFCGKFSENFYKMFR